MTEPLTIVGARILTLAPPGAPAGPRRGRWADELGVIDRGWVRIRDGLVEALGAGDPDRANAKGASLDARGRALLPGFVDCHTHMCYAGDRYGEADERLRGVPYLEILARGGGIMATVRATRAASVEELAVCTLGRMRAAARLGTTALEIKSGYGLTADSELRMLDAIARASSRTRQLVVPTFLGAHALDPENPRCVDEVIRDALPKAAAASPGIVADAYCEEGAWSVADCERYFDAARSLGCPIRVHSDQFHALGMTPLAVARHAISVDHLEASRPEDLASLAASATVGVGLPGCGFHLDGRYAPLRELLERGGAVALATNCNPGSSPTVSIPFVVALACRHMRLTPAQCLVATTINAAHVLGVAERCGSIEPGKRADLQLLPSRDERSLAYEYAAPGPDRVWIAGEEISARDG